MQLQLQRGQTLEHIKAAARTAQGKTLMPDSCDLTLKLAFQAFDLLDQTHFIVDARLSVDRPETFRDLGLLQSILLMAYNEGRQSVGGEPEVAATLAPQADVATRLRQLCTLLGLADAIPETDAELLASQFSVLGTMRRKVEQLKAAAGNQVK